MKSKIEVIEVTGATVGILVAVVAIIGLPRLGLAVQFFEGTFPTPAEAGALAFLGIWAGAVCMAAMTLGSIAVHLGRDIARRDAYHRQELLEKIGEIGLGSLGLGLLGLALVHGQQVHPGQIHEALALLQK